MSIPKPTDTGLANAALRRVGRQAFEVAVNSTRGFVAARLFQMQRRDELDTVMSDIAVTTWRNLDSYDPARGSLGGYVQGIAQTIIRRVAAAPSRPPVSDRQLHDAIRPMLSPSHTADPLSVLVSRFERDRWVRHITDEVGDRDWSIVAAMAIDGSHTNAATIATQLGVTIRTLRGIRERVTVTAQTVIAAIAAAEAGHDLVPATIDACIPTTRGLAAVNQLVAAGLSAQMIAEKIGVSEDSVRHRIAEAEQLRHVAMRVMIAEAATWPAL